MILEVFDNIAKSHKRTHDHSNETDEEDNRVLDQNPTARAEV